MFAKCDQTSTYCGQLLSRTIASIRTRNCKGNDDDGIQRQRGTNSEVRKSLSLLHRFMTKRVCNEKSVHAFNVYKRTVDLCIAESKRETTRDTYLKRFFDRR